MSEYDLIPDEAWEAAPEEDNDRFVFLVRTAQTNLTRMLDNGDARDFADEVRSQFVSIVYGVADALGIEGLPPVGPDLIDYRKYQAFQMVLAGVIARVRVNANLIPKPFSVELGRITKARIHQEIERLRRSIEASDLDPKKRAALLDRLADLETELAKRRVGYAKVMAIASQIAWIVGGGTAFLAEVPDAVSTIANVLQWMGQDKDVEEAERLRLCPPPKALPDYSEPAIQNTAPSFADDLDDDVPF